MPTYLGEPYPGYFDEVIEKINNGSLANISVEYQGTVETNDQGAEVISNLEPSGRYFPVTGMSKPLDSSISFIDDPDRGPVVTIDSDGQVTLGEGYTLDEASTQFWEVVMSMNPFKERIADLEEQISQLKHDAIVRDASNDLAMKIDEEVLDKILKGFDQSDSYERAMKVVE